MVTAAKGSFVTKSGWCFNSGLWVPSRGRLELLFQLMGFGAGKGLFEVVVRTPTCSGGNYGH